MSNSSGSSRLQRFKERPYIYWPLLGFSALIGIVAILGIISILADFGSAQEQLYHWGILSRFQSRHDDEILIVIATFDSGSGASQSDIQEELRANIEDQQRQLGLSNLRVEVDPTIIPATDRQSAEQLGDRHDATLIIWGSDTDFRIETNFLDTTRTEGSQLGDITIQESENTVLTAPAKYVQFVTNELAPQIVFLSLYAIGKANLADTNYESPF